MQQVMSASPSYDFRKPDERGEWLDIFVALIQYLKSGESKVGYLNSRHPRNRLNNPKVGLSSRWLIVVGGDGIRDGKREEGVEDA